MKKTILLATAAAALCAGPALAGDKAEKAAKMAAKFEKMDADANGSVSEAEFLAHKRAASAEKGEEMTAEKEAKATAWFAKASGEDGALTLDEMKTAYMAGRGKRKG